MTIHEKCIMCKKNTMQKITGMTMYFVLSKCLVCGFVNTVRKEVEDDKSKR